MSSWICFSLAALFAGVALIAFVRLVYTKHISTAWLGKTTLVTFFVSVAGLLSIQWALVYRYPPGGTAGSYNFFNAILVGAGIGAIIIILWWLVRDRVRDLLEQWKYISTSR